MNDVRIPSPPRGGRDLPWVLFGRRIRPFSFALSLACGVIAFALLGLDNDTGDVFDATRQLRYS